MTFDKKAQTRTQEVFAVQPSVHARRVLYPLPQAFATHGPSPRPHACRVLALLCGECMIYVCVVWGVRSMTHVWGAPIRTLLITVLYDHVHPDDDPMLFKVHSAKSGIHTSCREIICQSVQSHASSAFTAAGPGALGLIPDITRHSSVEGFSARARALTIEVEPPRTRFGTRGNCSRYS